MDLERATLRTLFYDYPIELAMRHIASYLRGENDSFLSDFPQIIRWTESQYSVSELRLVGKLLEHEAKETREAIHPKLLNTQSGVFANAICMIPQIAKRWLVFNNEHEMIVHFNEMFRWRDMTVLFGEDFFTTAYLAWTDLKNLNSDCTSFEWSEVIRHDNKVLDDILGKGLSEVHSHYNASTDVFHFNWLCLMNHIDYSERITSIKGDLQEQRNSLLAIEQLYKFKNICVAAAYLRSQLFRFVYTHESLEELKLCLVEKILSDDAYCAAESDKLQNTIAALGRFALCDNGGKILDYAITNDSCPLDNIYIMYKGERQLLYWLYRYIFENGDNAHDIAPYFYLYLLIKNFIRREIVETNQLLGFENFEIYQSRKSVFLKYEDAITAHMPQFVYQMNTKNGDTAELRITPGELRTKILSKHGAPIFDDQYEWGVDKKLSFVVHFIKDKSFVRKADKFATRVEFWKHYSNQLKNQVEQVVQHYQKIREARKQGIHELPQLAGIDAASNELYCRPEIFGHVYRYAALEGILNRTYHVGEDFFDLIDGLRAIDEAIEFLQLDNNCRLGHVLALGTNAIDYYTKRHYTTITYKQYLLDNLVWLYQKARYYNVNLVGILEDTVRRNALRLYNEIGYKEVRQCKAFSIDNYWDSMWLRSDDSVKAETVEDKKKVALLPDKWQQTANYDGQYARFTIQNEIAQKLYNAYLSNKHVFFQGNAVEIFKWPKEIVEVVTQIQDKMIAEIAEKQIAIECNPSSNVKIGHFDRYDEHPIFRFRPIDKNIHTPLLNVSINTDDRGVFATSLYNEFSLIALALTKQRDKDGNRLYNDEAICEYIDHIRQNNIIQRFKV